MPLQRDQLNKMYICISHDSWTLWQQQEEEKEKDTQKEREREISICM